MPVDHGTEHRRDLVAGACIPVDALIFIPDKSISDSLQYRDHPFADDERNHDDTPGVRSVRGGSWYSASIAYLYIPYRDSFQPEHSNQELGFRVVAKALP